MTLAVGLVVLLRTQMQTSAKSSPNKRPQISDVMSRHKRHNTLKKIVRCQAMAILVLVFVDIVGE